MIQWYMKLTFELQRTASCLCCNFIQILWSFVDFKHQHIVLIFVSFLLADPINPTEGISKLHIWTSSSFNTLLSILPQQWCSCNEIGTILCTVPDAKQLWLQTGFPYCHYWGYCNGLITSFPCHVFQKELNQAPPPPPCVCLAHFIPFPRFSPHWGESRSHAATLAPAEECLLSVFHSLSSTHCCLWLLPNTVGNDITVFKELQSQACAQLCT